MKEDRSLTKIRKLFDSESQSTPIFTSSTDIGVRRNGGRNGARFAPRVILEQFKNMVFHQDDVKFKEIEVSNRKEEENNFANSQKAEGENIKSHLNKEFPLHIGGGHDHIYPLLKAIESKHKKIFIINIDAHCDTRPDSEPHSGNPFRRFSEELSKDTEFTLLQFGIHSYANSPSTLKELPNGKMVLLKNPNDSEALFNYLDKIDLSDAALILSLDSDGLSSNIMRAVSAVNHYGTNADTMKEILTYFNNKKALYKCFGIYEYNPLYEDESLAGARFLADLIYSYFHI